MVMRRGSHAPNLAAGRTADDDVPMPDRPAKTAEPVADVEVDSGAEDEVIAECDVYLNHMQDPEIFQGDLYMLQYPHRPAYRPYGDQGVLRHVEVEKAQRRLRLTYKLDTEASHYNRHARVLTKDHVLLSSACDNPNVSYCIAALHDGKLTMTPLRSFLQCRTDLNNDEDSDDEADLPRDVFGETEVKMNFTKAKKRVEKPVVKPVWDEFFPFDVNSRETYNAYEHFVRTTDDEVEFKTQDVENLFIERMCGAQKMHDAMDSGSSCLSTFVLSRMSLASQVESIMWESEGAMSFSDIRKRLAPQTKKTLRDTTLLELLNKICICVKNTWVLQHDKLGFSDWASRVRESLLFGLNTSGFMTLDRLKKNFHKVMSPEMLIDVAKTCGAIRKTDSGEERVMLPETTDNIAEMFPLAAEKTLEYWKTKKAVVWKTMTDIRDGAAPMTPQVAKQMQDDRFRLRLQHEVRVLLLSAARTVTDLQRKLQEKHPNNDISESLLKSVLAKATLRAGNIRSVWYLVNIEGRLDQYRQCVISLFKENSSVTAGDLLELTKKAGRPDLTDLEVCQLLSEFATLDGDRWVFRE